MNILFTCAGRRTYLLNYFKENMGNDDKVVATDMHLSAPALQVADVKLQVPGVYDTGYINVLLGICKDYGIDALLSLNDLELPLLAKNKARFESLGVKVVVSDPEVIDIAFDKYRTVQWVESVGLTAPKTYVHLADAKAALSSGAIHFPLFLKPRWGSGSICLESVDDMEELDICYNLLHKRIKSSILTTASVGDEYVIIQEKLSGDEFGLDVMNDLEGRNAGVSVKKKLAMRAGETDKAVTVDVPELREIGRRLGETLGHIGNLDVDIMQRADGAYCILELNPRFGGGYPFSHEAGVNMPLAIMKWLRGETVDPSLFVPQYGRMFSKNDYLMEIK